MNRDIEDSYSFWWQTEFVAGSSLYVCMYVCNIYIVGVYKSPFSKIFKQY